ncbi:MAG: hypothetical protein KUG77_02530 [Nannocystaceae bacterium]|nr:hypothetical protein [Nannocystaceae bacterium]
MTIALLSLAAGAKKAKLLADKLVDLGRKNDDAVAAAFAEARDGLVVENAQSIAALASGEAELRGQFDEIREQLAGFSRIVMDAFPEWSEFDDEKRPTSDDVETALLRYRGDYRRAGSHAKRKLLFSALIGEFNPKLYGDGWNRIFGDIARELQPPHVAELRLVIAERTREPRSTVGRSAGLDGFLLVKELDRLHLVSAAAEGAGGNFLTVEPTKSGERFLEFLWDYDEDE